MPIRRSRAGVHDDQARSGRLDVWANVVATTSALSPSVARRDAPIPRARERRSPDEADRPGDARRQARSAIVCPEQAHSMGPGVLGRASRGDWTMKRAAPPRPRRRIRKQTQTVWRETPSATDTAARCGPVECACPAKGCPRARTPALPRTRGPWFVSVPAGHDKNLHACGLPSSRRCPPSCCSSSPT